MTEQEAHQQPQPPGEWMILELLGHRKLAGFVTEVQRYGTALIQVEVYRGDEEAPTLVQRYSPSALFGETPCAEAVARRFAAGSSYRPVTAWELERALPSYDGPDDEEIEEAEFSEEDCPW